MQRKIGIEPALAIFFDRVEELHGTKRKVHRCGAPAASLLVRVSPELDALGDRIVEELAADRMTRSEFDGGAVVPTLVNFQHAFFSDDPQFVIVRSDD